MNDKKILNSCKCCFTGHRPEKLVVREMEVKQLLRIEIEKAIHEGFTTFISGMSRGIDIWAAEIVLDKRRNDNRIKLICACPYDGFEKRWNTYEKEEYQNILKKADLVKYVCNHYSKTCFQLRNAYMVDLSKRVIAAYNGEKGGTQNTIKYAKSKNVEVVNIFMYNVEI